MPTVTNAIVTKTMSSRSPTTTPITTKSWVFRMPAGGPGVTTDGVVGVLVLVGVVEEEEEEVTLIGAGERGTCFL